MSQFKDANLTTLESEPSLIPAVPLATCSVTEPESAPASMRRWLWAFVQVAFGIGALGWVLRKADLAQVWQQVSQANLWLIGAAILCNALTLICMAFRLGLLARVHVPTTSYRRLALAQFKAAFVNGFVPGSLGGDAVRFVTLQQSGFDKTLGLAVLIVERLVGTWGVVLTGGAALVVNHRYLDMHQWITGVAGLLVGLLVLTGVLFHNQFDAQVSRLVEQVGQRGGHNWLARKFVSIATRLLAAAERFRLAHRVLWWSLVVSLVVRAVWVVSAYFVALSLGMNLSLPLLFGVISLVDIARMLPIAPPNGIGVREAMLVFLLSQTGIDREAALGFSLVVSAVMVANSLLGGLISIGQGVRKFRQTQ
ncbi:MAG: flippase-like domain-containing protein [Blastocatellia bacterium]|nr:flippase-like domain-containing protein [Blastocatellia bacterium]